MPNPSDYEIKPDWLYRVNGKIYQADSRGRLHPYNGPPLVDKVPWQDTPNDPGDLQKRIVPPRAQGPAPGVVPNQNVGEAPMAAKWVNGRMVRDDQDAEDLKNAFRFVPQAPKLGGNFGPGANDLIMGSAGGHSTSIDPRTGKEISHYTQPSGFAGFGGMLQGAMAQGAQMNLANQGASLHNRDTAAGLEAARMQAMAPVMAESIRASALAAMFGVGKGSAKSPAEPRYSSNIGQGINFYPKYHGWRNMPSMMAYAKRE